MSVSTEHQTTSNDPYQAAIDAGLSEFVDNVDDAPNGESRVSSADQPNPVESGKPDQPAPESANKEENPEDILEKLANDTQPEESEDESDQPDEESNTVESQSFTLKIDGEEVVKNLTPAEIVAELQKAHNYTQSKQELSNSIKEKEAELKAYEDELNQKIEQVASSLEGELNIKKQWDAFVEHMKSQDTEWYEDLVTNFRAYQTQFDNPVVKAYEEKLSRIEKALLDKQESDAEKAEQAQLKELRETYEKEMGAVKSAYLPQLEKLGIPFSEDRIKKMWSEDGYPTVKAAFMEAYGEQIQKRYESLSKVTKASKNAGRKSPTVAGKTRGSIKLPDLPENIGSYDSLIEHFISGPGSKVFNG